MEIIHRDTDYALRALAQMGGGDQELISAATLAENVHVPVDFMRKIMQRIKTAGLAQSVRGPFGGYCLSRKPEDISLYEVIVAIQGPLRMNACFVDPGICENSGNCGLKNMLVDVEKQLNAYLQSITLADIIRRLER